VPLDAAVEKVADTFPVDGLWMDKKGNLYLSGLTPEWRFSAHAGGAY
jgi:hypothetical protein